MTLVQNIVIVLVHAYDLSTQEGQELKVIVHLKSAWASKKENKRNEPMKNNVDLKFAEDEA